MAGRETKLTNKIRDAILAAAAPGVWVTKIHGGPYQQAGIPDLVGCLHGRMFGLEVKAPAPGESDEHARERVTERQQITLDAIARAGGIAAVVLSSEEALRALGLNDV